MFSEKLHKMKEEAHVGQELLDSDPLSDLDRKCVTVKQVVQEKDFTLEEDCLYIKYLNPIMKIFW
jgi:hypothetical protein